MSAYFSHSGLPSTSPPRVWGAVLPVILAADGERLDANAVDTDVELLLAVEAGDVVVDLPAEANLDQVLGVHRKVMANREAAARPERQVFAELTVLQRQVGDV